MNVPLKKINDFVTEIGSSENVTAFIKLTLRTIGRLIPFDTNGMFVNVDQNGKISSWESIAEYRQWVDLFNNHYWSTMPDLNGHNTHNTNWSDFPTSEFGNDFLRPQHICYSIGIFHFGNMDCSSALTLHRSKNIRQFNQNDQKICEILRPHLTNLYRLYTRLEDNTLQIVDSKEFSEKFKNLTHREAEIAFLIYQRYTTGMIQSKLLISRLTVYKHIENIFFKLKVNSRDELIRKVTVRS